MREDKHGEPEQPTNDEALRDKVDGMMAARGPDSIPAVSMGFEDAPKDTKDQKSAPELPKTHKPAEQTEPAAAPPIVIHLVDEKPPEAVQVPVAAAPPAPLPETPVPETAAPPAPELPPAPILPAEPTPEQPSEEPLSEAIPDDVPPALVPDTATNLDDSVTEEAVDDIAAKDGDLLLAVDDARTAQKEKAVEGPGFKDKLKGLAKNKWTCAVAAVLLLVVLALPATRYTLLGLAIKRPVTITIQDSKTGTPVSSAQVELGGVSAKTDANGRAHLNAPLGKRALKVTKQYYSLLTTTYFVGFKAPAVTKKVYIFATGRLVPITVLNTVTGKPLSGAEVKLQGTTAKTNSKGQATVALPTTAGSYSAQLSLKGYNTATITVQVTDQVVKANSFTLTPAGHVYFLSNLNGSIDVVKSNLDGTGRKTVLAGTGKEDKNTTSLLASRDWRYLALKARRDTSQPALYLIDTSTDKVTSIDSGDADFTLVGWYGHNFIYDLTRNTLSNWQPARIALKSYDADNLQLNQLDQSQAEGSSDSYAYQVFNNYYIVNGLVVYNTQWNTFTNNGTAYDTTGKSDVIRAVQPNGQNKKDYQSFPAATTSYIQASLYEPQSVYFAVADNTGKTSYFSYEDQVVKPTSIDVSAFNQAYPTFLVSPSGNKTFWTELRDGKNTLFTGDSNASSKKQIASLSDYSPYGWYGDNYVLVSKNSSQLYIMPAGGLATGQQPLKVTDYYKPTQNFNGYGYGYGGL